jgi:hypothetical protein
LATGICTPQPPLLSHHGRLAGCSAARLPDGRIVCVGRNLGGGLDGTAKVLEPPGQGSPREASWQWRYLPGMSVGRCKGSGCVLSDGRFAVFGGYDDSNRISRTCEVSTLDGGGERWDPLPSMHEARMGSACAAIGGCVIVAGGDYSDYSDYSRGVRGSAWTVEAASFQPSPRRIYIPSSLDEQRVDVIVSILRRPRESDSNTFWSRMYREKNVENVQEKHDVISHARAVLKESTKRRVSQLHTITKQFYIIKLQQTAT